MLGHSYLRQPRIPAPAGFLDLDLPVEQQGNPFAGPFWNWLPPRDQIPAHLQLPFPQPVANRQPNQLVFNSRPTQLQVVNSQPSKLVANRRPVVTVRTSSTQPVAKQKPSSTQPAAKQKPPSIQPVVNQKPASRSTPSVNVPTNPNLGYGYPGFPGYNPFYPGGFLPPSYNDDVRRQLQFWNQQLGSTGSKSESKSDSKSKSKSKSKSESKSKSSKSDSSSTDSDKSSDESWSVISHRS